MKLALIGGGAANLMLASILVKNNFKGEIVIFEKEEHVGKKILVSGNGRCNLSNKNIKEIDYNNKFGYEIAKSFNVEEYFNDLGLLTTTDEQGRIYPYSNVSNSVLDILRNSIKNVNILTNTTIIRIIKENDSFLLFDKNNKTYLFDYVVLATGSKAYYKETNSYMLATMLAHHITLTRPSITYIRVKENLASLENIKLKVKARLLSNNEIIYENYGEVLFKKDYLSGIIMFELSMIINKDPFKKYVVSLDLLPCFDEYKLQNYLLLFNNDLTGLFPKMVNQYLIKNSIDLASSIKDLRFNVIENIDFKAAQVVSGGININEINDNLESKIIKNLYFAGEILDVDGMCGGYNLHFAFASASKIANDLLKKDE